MDAECLVHLRTHLQAVYARIQKHLCQEMDLYHVAWESFSELMMASYTRYSNFAKICYGIDLRVSCQDLKTLLRQIEGSS